METFLGLDVTAWTAIYTLLTSGLLLVAIVAAGYAHRQWKSSRDHAVEQRKAQIEAMRPYVTVTVEPGQASMHLFDLIVRNIGQRPAQDVLITLEPPPIRAREHDGLQTSARTTMQNMKMLNEPMSLLAPGQEIRAFYDSHLDRKNREDLPTEHTVRVSYSDTSGHGYEGQFTLDLLALKGMSWTEVGTIHTISRSLKGIEKTLNGAEVLKNGRLVVRATTEAHRDSLMREEIEDHQQLKGHVQAMRKFSPQDPGLAGYERTVAAQEAEFQRRMQDEAVEPIRRRIRRAQNAIAWARRRLHERRATDEP